MFKNFKTYLIALFGFGFILSACTENTTNPTDNTPKPKPSPISNLMATSKDDKTVILKFTNSPSETNTLFKDYELVITPGTYAPMYFPKGTNQVTISNLQEGSIYTFSIAARYTNDSVSTPVSISWSPATRFVKNNNDAAIRVYETASDFGSGLRLFSPSDKAPRTYKVSSGAEWDLGLDTRNSKIIFGSATKIDYNYPTKPQPTQVLNQYFEADSLNAVFDSQAMNAGARDANYAERTFDLTTVNTKNLVFYVRKYEPGQTRYNYAKVMIKKNPSGGYLFGTSPNRYIELEISYQSKPDVPYAKTSAISQNNK